MAAFEVNVQVTETPGPPEKGGHAAELILTADRDEGPPPYYATITLHDVPAAQRSAYVLRKVKELWGIRGDIVIKGLPT